MTSQIDICISQKNMGANFECVTESQTDREIILLNLFGGLSW